MIAVRRRPAGRSTSIRRVAIALAAILVLLLPGSAGAASRVASAVTWTIDHPARTITATVRLRLGSTCTRAQMVRAVAQGPAAAKRCKVGPEVAKAIKDNVDAVWNAGHMFGCYKIKVVTDIEVVDDLTGAVDGSDKTPDTRAYVAIDQSATPVRSMVSSHAFEDARWNGNTSHDANYPSNGSREPSTWKYPPTWERSLYAHEVGHVIGLSDHYDDFVGEDGKTYSRPKNGAPTDVMSSVTVTNVDPSTINRLVERAGTFMFDLKCDYTIDLEVAGGRMTGTKCGGPLGDWIIDTDIKQGAVQLTQHWVVTIRDVRGNGDFTYENHSLTKVPGSEAEGWGESSGTALVTLFYDGWATMHLEETKDRTRGRTTAGGRTIRIPWTDAPLVPWDFTWKPTVCPPAN